VNPLSTYIQRVVVPCVEPRVVKTSQIPEGPPPSDNMEESVQQEGLISRKLQIPSTRFSNRIQDQLLTKDGGSLDFIYKKKSIQGTYLTILIPLLC
jgi:hypothetical protein